MTATYIFGRKTEPGESSLPLHPVFDKLTDMAEQGYLLIPLVDEDDPLGIPPLHAAHFSRRGEQLKQGDRPPIHAIDDPFKAAFLSNINYRGYKMGFPYHSGISPARGGDKGRIVGFHCYISDLLKEALRENSERKTFVSVIGPEGFERKEPKGQGNSLYAEASITPVEVARFAISLGMMGVDLLERAQDPIVDPTIRSFYHKMGVRAADIAVYESTSVTM